MKKSENRPLIIGIAGGAGSGKTTLSRQLKQSLYPIHVRLLEMDRYYKKQKPQFEAPLSGKLYDDFNHPDAIDIERIRLEINQILDEGQADIVIIEGFLLFHYAELLTQLALKIYVDCPPEERLLRRLESYRKWGISAEELSEYLHVVRRRHDEFVEPTRWQADLFVNGMSHNELLQTMIIEWIMQTIKPG